MLPIVTIPNELLRKKSSLLTREEILNPGLQVFLKEMIPAMYHYDGIGLAAPQVGKGIQACVIGKNADETLSTDLILINPTWEKTSRKTNTDLEGCLSVPNKYGKVKRHTDIIVNALNLNGSLIKFEAHGFFARVIQHETDHLNGILFIDKAWDIYTVKPEQKL